MIDLLSPCTTAAVTETLALPGGGGVAGRELDEQMMCGSSARHRGSVENVILLGSEAGRRREGGEGWVPHSPARWGLVGVGLWAWPSPSHQGPVSQVAGATDDSRDEKWFIFKLAGLVLPA